MKKESKFQHNLIKKIEKRFEGSIVLKNDPTYIRGIPDLLILYKDKWAALECKKSESEYKQSPKPHQDFYVRYLNNMSFASFISPENEEEVLNDIQRTFES